MIIIEIFLPWNYSKLRNGKVRQLKILQFGQNMAKKIKNQTLDNFEQPKVNKKEFLGHIIKDSVILAKNVQSQA